MAKRFGRLTSGKPSAVIAIALSVALLAPLNSSASTHTRAAATTAIKKGATLALRESQWLAQSWWKSLRGDCGQRDGGAGESRRRRLWHVDAGVFGKLKRQHR